MQRPFTDVSISEGDSSARGHAVTACCMSRDGRKGGWGCFRSGCLIPHACCQAQATRIFIFRSLLLAPPDMQDVQPSVLPNLSTCLTPLATLMSCSRALSCQKTPDWSLCFQSELSSPCCQTLRAHLTAAEMDCSGVIEQLWQ